MSAAAALAALSKGLDLDDVLLVGGEGELHRGGVGLHDAGPTVPVPFVEHLQTKRKEEGREGKKTTARESEGFFSRSEAQP